MESLVNKEIMIGIWGIFTTCTTNIPHHPLKKALSL